MGLANLLKILLKYDKKLFRIRLLKFYNMEYQKKIDLIIPFLLEHRILIDSHVTAAYIIDYFKVIPDSWFDYLSTFTYLELLSISSDSNIVLFT